mgnify:CR=1 FL=1
MINKYSIKNKFFNLVYNNQDSDKAKILQKIKNVAFNYLSYRSRSKNEIYLKLNKSFFNEKYIKMVLSELELKGDINDELFANDYARTLIDKKLLSRKAVEDKFYKHKISNDILKPVLDSLYHDNDEKKIIEKLIYKKKYMLNGFNSEELIRVSNYLGRKGFNWNDIRIVVDRIKAEF